MENEFSSAGRTEPTIVIQNLPAKEPWFIRRLFWLLFVVSILANFVFYGMYIADSGAGALEVFKEGDRNAKDKIAVIKVHGFITIDGIQSPKRELEYAAEDDAVKAIILDVDSPGGTIAGSDELYHAIEKFKEKKNIPIVVAMRGLGTSGAYYISMPAQRIFAQRSCVTGSIGVISSLFNFEKFLSDWGVKSEVVKSGPMKDSGSPFRTMTKEERENWQKLIDDMYGLFLGVVLKYRSEAVGGEEKLRTVADGRVYLAEDAKTLGLIDEIGYFDDAVAYSKSAAGIKGDARIISYARPLGGLLDLFDVKANAAARSDGMTRALDLATPQFWLLPGAFVAAER